MTLERKARLFEQRVALRHNRHGMVADSRLTRAGDLTSNVPESSDNDGLWTSMCGAAQCFRYSVTHDSEALRQAARSVEALLYLEKITGIPGFPARSYVKPGETQPQDGVWYDNTGEGLRWKADTSSDEVVGHFFLFSIAFDMLPDPELKRRIAATTGRIIDHILSHGYHLVDDHTGKPTTWGKWSPEYFATKGGRGDSPLNALELLSFLRAARAHHRRPEVRRGIPEGLRGNGLHDIDGAVPGAVRGDQLFRRGTRDAIVLYAVPSNT